jgi:hypothetical protein
VIAFPLSPRILCRFEDELQEMRRRTHTTITTEGLRFSLVCLFVCVAASNKYRVFWSPSEFLAYECWAVTVNSTIPVFTMRQARCHGRMAILCRNGTRLYREFDHAALGNEVQFHLAQRGRRLTTPSGGEYNRNNKFRIIDEDHVCFLLPLDHDGFFLRKLSK